MRLPVLFCFSAGLIFGQGICRLSTPTPPPVLRAEGLAEPAGDILVDCQPGVTGGLPAIVNVTLAVSHRLGNRTTPDGFTDIFLILNDPHTAAHPSIPLLACGAPGTFEDEAGGCQPMLDSPGVFSGTDYNPNVFQGKIGNGGIVFRGVPLAMAKAFTLRVTGIRVAPGVPDTSYTPVAGDSGQNQVRAFLSLNYGQQPEAHQWEAIVGTVQPGISVWTSGLYTARSCGAMNGALYADPAASASDGAGIAVTVRENFAGALRPKNYAGMMRYQAGAASIQAPDVNQNIPGWAYYTETTFYNGALDPNPQVVPGLSSTSVFPNRRGLATAGLADQGTRVVVRFPNLPAGVKLFAPVQIDLQANDGQLPDKVGVAMMVVTDSNGAGTVMPVANGSGLAPVPAPGGVPTLVYEIAGKNPARRGDLIIRTTPAWAAGGVAGNSEIRVEVALAPQSSAIGPSSDASIAVPRFRTAASFAGSSAAITSCGRPNLSTQVTHTGTFQAGGVGSFQVSVGNLSGAEASTSGTVRASIAVGAGLTITGLTGAGWSCDAGSMPVSCTRTDSLNVGQVFPPIALATLVASNPPDKATVTATVSGGGETYTGDDTDSHTVELVEYRSVQVGTNPPGALFSVDSVTYSSSQTFRWAVNSSHTVEGVTPQSIGGKQYVWQSWSDGQPLRHTVVATSSVTSLTANLVAFGPLVCEPVYTPSGNLRTGAMAELLGDYLLKCTAPASADAGTVLPGFDLTLTFSVPLTSRATGDGFTEALLLVQEPHSVGGSNYSLLVCGAPGSGDDGTGRCQMTSAGDALNTYLGTSGRPNVFQGRFGATKYQMTWKDVPLGVASESNPLWLRFTNVRGDLSNVSTGSVTGSLSVSPGGVAVVSPSRIFGYPGDDVSVRSIAFAFRQCIPANPSIARDASQALDSALPNGSQVTMSIVSAAMPKNIAQWLANKNGEVAYPADLNQNVPGAVYYSESGFLNNAADPYPNPPNLLSANSVRATPPFPDIRGLRDAGRADTGTRFFLKFSNIPEGVQLFVPSELRDRAALVSTDEHYGGAYQRVVGNSSGLARLAVRQGSATAVYEVLLPFAFSTGYTVPVAIAYDLDNGWPNPAWVTVEWGLGPLTYPGSTSIPRFGVVAGRSASVFAIESCGGPNLVASVTPQSVFAQGDQGDRIVAAVKNAGTGPSTGATLDMALPAALTVVSAAGDGWNCMTSPLRCVSTTAIAPNGGISSEITLIVNVSSSADSSGSVRATASGGGQSEATSRSTTVALTISAASSAAALVRVNAGGAAYTDGAGHVWSADNGYLSGSTYSTGSSIANTADGPLYQTERWNQGKLQYHFAVPNGTYAVNLKFAEIYFTSAGKRVFHIAINGQTVQSNFDIVAAAGAGHKAIDKTYSVAVTSGAIDIDLIAVIDNPKISAIEIISTVPSGSTVATPVFSLAAGTYASAQAVTITSTSGATIRYTTDGSTPTPSSGTIYSSAVTITTTTTLKAIAYKSGWIDSATASATYTIAPRVGTTIRVNAGGPDYYDSKGHAWSADTGYVGGNSYSTTASVANTADAALYQTERWGQSKVQYQFQVLDGAYGVNLKFAEIYFTSSGKRVFDIVINGRTAEYGFDIVKAAGGANRAIDLLRPVIVEHGIIDIQLVGVTENPKINAIEITPAGPATVATPTFSVAGGSYTSTQTVVIRTATAGATIRYTTDGSTPSSTSGTVYSGAVTIATTTTLKAIAYQDGWNDSFVAEATYTIAPPSSTTGTTIRVNAGGPAYTDGAGHVWSADTGYLAGNTYSTGASIANTADAVLYQTERWNPTKLEYRFVVDNGSYTVNLKFAELYFTSAGQRVFDIVINGQTVQSNFDIVARAGGANRAVESLHTWAINDGVIDIQLIGVTENPKINAIEILPVSSGTGTVATPTFSVAGGTYASAQTVAISTATAGATIRYSTDGSTPSSTSGSVYNGAVTVAATATVKAIAYKSGWNDSSVMAATYTIAPPSSTTGTTIRVNAGGPSYTDGSGHVWSADTGFVAGNAYATGASIGNTSDATLYQTERWNPTKLEYRFTVDNGSYTVNLKFAELYFTSAGQRVFDIVINGQKVQSNFDVVAAAPGGNRAVDKSYAVTVTDGSIDIQLVAVTENPKINAIEILPVSSGPGTVAAPVFSVAGGSYTSTQTVAISTSTPGATIRYTMDGSTPTSSSGTVYGGAVTISSTKTLKAMAYKSGMSDSTVTSATYTISSAPSSGTTIRVNVGGPAYTDGAGHVWSADSGYVAGNAYASGAVIANTTDGVLYQTERWNPTKLQCRFTVANGSYVVNLKFAELYFTSAGKRVFNIVINGQTVQSGFDIVAAAGGGNRAIDQFYTVAVTDGTIDIQLTAVTENPKVNAIEIVPLS